jgi:hypothetical protein
MQRSPSARGGSIDERTTDFGLDRDRSRFALDRVPVSDPEAFPIAGVVATAHNGTGGFAENARG